MWLEQDDQTRSSSNAVRYWSLTMLWEKFIKIGAKVTWHAKDVTFQRLRWPWRGTCSSRSSTALRGWRPRRQRSWMGRDSWDVQVVKHEVPDGTGQSRPHVDRRNTLRRAPCSACGCGRAVLSNGNNVKPSARDRLGERGDVRMEGIANLDRFQAQLIWEMSVATFSNDHASLRAMAT